jgi:endonuclease/exonuclease/phosphatase family metal-dependent hydrolase
MRTLRVVTWNVLHRVHGLNWHEAPMTAFPDEGARSAGIAERVRAWLAGDVAVVCLQEVSGDQLACLRRVLPAGARVFEHTHPRVPALRGGGTPGLDDLREHLVTITTLPLARRTESRAFDEDRGKGYLVVDLGDGVRVVDTHVTWGAAREAQIPLLAAAARAAPGGAIVLGDFNASAATVRAILGEPVALSELEAQRPTRIGSPSQPGKTIDHVAVFGGVVDSATVLDGEGLSDHEPVAATVRFVELTTTR